MDAGRSDSSCAEPERLYGWAARNRVLPQILAHLPPDLRDREEQAVERARARRRSVVELVARASGRDAAVVLTKGFAIERFYPGYESGSARRQFNDVDVQVQDLDALWPLHARLRGVGLRLGAMAVRRPPDGGPWSAAARYDLDGHGALEGETVDVDIGPLWLGGRSHVPLAADYFADAVEIAQGPRVRLSGRRAGLVRLLAEVAERKRLVLRDVLDFVALDTDEPLLHEADARASGRLDRTRRVLAARALRLDRLVPFLDARDRMRMAGAAAALVDGLRLAGARLQDAVSELKQGFSQSGAPLLAGPSRLARAIERQFDPRDRLERGDWIQLLPLAAAPRGPSGWLERGDAVVLRTPIGCFATALFGAVDGNRFGSLLALCDETAEASRVATAAGSTASAR